MSADQVVYEGEYTLLLLDTDAFANLTEVGLYGLFVPAFIASLYFLKAGHQKVNKLMLLTSVTMFCLATAHLITQLYCQAIHSQKLFYHLRPATKARAIALHELTRKWTMSDAAGGVIYVVQTLIGDAFIVYRVYMVWEKARRVVMLPAFCLLMSIAFAITELALPDPSDGDEFKMEVVNIIWIAFMCSTLLINLLCSGLIAGRLWFTYRRTTALGETGPIQSRLVRAAVVIMEAGAIYVVLVVIYVASYRANSPDVSILTVVVRNGLVQAIGIVFSLIIIRVGLGLNSACGRTSSKWAVSYAPPDGVEDRVLDIRRDTMALGERFHLSLDTRASAQSRTPGITRTGEWDASSKWNVSYASLSSEFEVDRVLDIRRHTLD